MRFGKIITAALAAMLLAGCQGATPSPSSTPETETSITPKATPTPTPYVIRREGGMTVATRFAPPEGYTRVTSEGGSFGEWLQNLPLKEDGSLVTLRADGSAKPDGSYDSVVDSADGSKQMEKTDFLLTLHASYLFSQNRYPEMAYHFYSGFAFDFDTWSEGKRIKVSGSKVEWVATGQPDASYAVYQAFLQELHTYANPLSLPRDVGAVSALQPGVILTRNRDDNKGWENALMVVDMATNEQGGIALLLAGCGSPAQDGYILANHLDAANAPWFVVPASGLLDTSEGLYASTSAMMFP